MPLNSAFARSLESLTVAELHAKFTPNLPSSKAKSPASISAPISKPPPKRRNGASPMRKPMSGAG